MCIRDRISICGKQSKWAVIMVISVASVRTENSVQSHVVFRPHGWKIAYGCTYFPSVRTENNADPRIRQMFHTKKLKKLSEEGLNPLTDPISFSTTYLKMKLQLWPVVKLLSKRCRIPNLLVKGGLSHKRLSEARAPRSTPVSYTHLTLPTKRIV